ncbi:MAG: 4-(cytidine 5'-diphospho)-2-C-methyl-D-erythritol kinase [Chthoniobacterales bacterium]|nr:4-(cytidine 5'-diphospho)-2-C-methyl-D-erythritol kinase [Chthoniobacterales bacterium]
MQLRAPAKVNLSFRILHRREDGFHEIETLMAPVSLYDDINIARLPAERGIEFTCDDSSLPLGEENLIVKAARLFLSAVSMATGLRIELRKGIPHGAGLGGGSSDAASTLLGLNELLGAALSLAELAELGGRIGSDVPFFIFRSAAVCSGRGEKVRAARLQRELPLLLLKPQFGVPTSWAYSRWTDSRELPHVGYKRQDFAGETFFNDLERPVFEKHLFLSHLKMWLLVQPETGAALMSGSGSTVFAVLREHSDADALAQRAKMEVDPGLWTSACATIAAA